MRLRIGTRGSQLARTQAASVAAALARHGFKPQLVAMRTAGDRSQATSFGSIGPQGVFVREIEQALIDGEVDLAVHSYKDLPTVSPEALVVACVPRRGDAADVVVASPSAVDANAAVLPLRAGSKVGTASARRQAWIKHLRPDLKVEPVRGNVPTRIGRVGERFDAVVLAAAGIERLQAASLEEAALDLENRSVLRLAPEDFPPAPAQGALAVQCRSDDSRMREALEALDHGASHACIDAERGVLARVEGGCDLAFGAHCTINGTAELALIAMLEVDGRLARAEARGAEPGSLAERVFAGLKP